MPDRIVAECATSSLSRLQSRAAAAAELAA
jgi:hypothetical protein